MTKNITKNDEKIMKFWKITATKAQRVVRVSKMYVRKVLNIFEKFSEKFSVFGTFWELHDAIFGSGRLKKAKIGQN